MWRRRYAAVLSALLLAFPGHSAWAANRADETEVKAAVIYNLLLFVHWPALTPLSGSFRFCVLEDGALTAALRHHERKAVRGQALEIRLVGAAPEELDTCVAVMVEAGNPGVLARLGVLARGRALLVIAEGSDAVDRGAMIGLYTHSGRVTFDIDRGAMKRSGLEPSSRILQLARTLTE